MLNNNTLPEKTNNNQSSPTSKPLEEMMKMTTKFLDKQDGNTSIDTDQLVSVVQDDSIYSTTTNYNKNDQHVEGLKDDSSSSSSDDEDNDDELKEISKEHNLERTTKRMTSHIRERTTRFLDECGSNYVLVDIDSLIDDAIYETDISGIDWNEHGGQWLHLFFYCESKLRNWRNSGMGFQLLYLKGNDPVTLNGPHEMNGKKLLRHLLFNHLQSVIANDPALKCRHSCVVLHQNIYENFDEFDRLCDSVNINSIVISPHNKKLLIFLLNKTTIPVISAIIGEGSAMSAIIFKVKDKYKVECNDPKEEKEIISPTSSLSMLQLFEKSIGDILTCDLDHQLAKVVIMTKLLQDYLPLNYRYLKVDSAITELNEFLERFYGKVFELLQLYNPLEKDNSDFFDGRFAHFILQWMISRNQVDFTLPKTVQSQYIEIVSRLGLKEYDGNSLNTLNSIITESTFQYEFQYNHEILPINNQFMVKLFDLPESVITTNSTKKVFKDEYHYHNTDKIGSVRVRDVTDEKSTALAKLVASFARPKKRVVVTPEYTSKDIKEELKSLQKKDMGRENYLKTTLPEKILSWREEYNKRSHTKTLFELSSSLFAEVIKLKRYERKITRQEEEMLKNNSKQVLELLVDSLFGQLELIKIENQEQLIQLSVWIRFINSFLEEYSNLFPSIEFTQYFQKLVNNCFKSGLFAIGNEIIQRKSLTLRKSDESEKFDIDRLYLECCETSSFFIPHPQQFSLTRVLKSLNDNARVSEMTPEEYRKYKIDQRLREDMDFIPDEWQEELINHVNNDNVSVLCNVPTSQGKTFICFYLIEKVLRESSNSVVCFVVPTKALVNQIYCEISSRFERPNLVGMATSTTRINEFNSQVLIITPAMLEIYLLSADNSAWKSRIKYLILDEIHSAFEGEQAPFYEHIIQFLDCPILGLSATLDNRNELANWMKHGKRQNVEIVYLEDYKRFNPLEYYSYDYHTGSVHIHPLALINTHNIEQELPLMNGMSMKECLELIDLLRTDYSEWFSQISQIIFKSDLLSPFRWVDAINFRRKIHEFLIEKSTQKENHETLCQMIGHFFKMSNISSLTQKENMSNTEIIDLVMTMKGKNMLPSISFVFNKSQINNYLLCLVEYLEEKSMNLWKDGKMPKSIAQTIYSIEEDGAFQVEETHMRALKVGLGAHYAAMDENYQLEVERLFRMGELPLIFSTSTLALGVNMPCKTVVICGFSSFYTNGLFKQACGRAGRRGFDNKGRIILCGFNLQLQRRYLLSPPVMVNGSKGLPTSFTLRLFSSLSSKNSNSIELEEGIKRLLERPLFSLDKNLVERAANQMKHFFRFNTEYLLQTEFLNENCEPLSLSGLVTHLFYLNEQAFTIPHLVKTKFFDKFKQVHSDTEQDLLLLKIITFLIYRIRGGSYLDEKHTIELQKEIAEDNQSSLILQEMIREVKVHNDMALSIYSNFASVYSIDKNEDLRDDSLPLGHSRKFKKLKLVKRLIESNNEKVEEIQEEDDWESFDVEESKSSDVQQSQENEPIKTEYILDESEYENDLQEISFIRHLSNSCMRNTISTSSFAALSGNIDGHYRSIDHFLQTLNHNISLTSSNIPIQDMEHHRLNAFLINLYKHKEIKKITGFSTSYAASRKIEEVIRDLKKIRSCLILEKCFSDSSFYHPYLNSSIKALLDRYRITWNLPYQSLFDQWRKGNLNSNLDPFFTQGKKYAKFLRSLEYLFRHPFMNSLDRVIKVFSRIVYGEPVYVTKKSKADIVVDDPSDDPLVNTKTKSKNEPKAKRPENDEI